MHSSTFKLCNAHLSYYALCDQTLGEESETRLHVLRWLPFVPRSMNENIRLAEIVEAVKELEQAIVKDSGIPREIMQCVT